MTSLSTEQYLDSFINHEIHLGQVHSSSFKLDRVQQLLKELNDFHKGLKVIHVAGSKGKGSICAVAAGILKNAGYKVGLYTSPHMNNYRERIRVLEQVRPGSKQTAEAYSGDGNGGPGIFPDSIKEDELCAIIDEVKPAIERVRSDRELGALSFFEVYTILALYYFYRRGVDLVVLETGLGGRLDATNAAGSLVAVIAPISLEHTHILGNTIAQIAEEKAGIIKDSGQKIIIAPQDSGALDVLKKRCDQFDIDPLQVGEAVKFRSIAQDIDGQTFDLETPKRKYDRIHLALLGKHQRDNAAAGICAVECLEDLGFTVPEHAVREGCRDVFWPGRLEAVRREPLVLLDGAHNAASAKALSETIREVLGGKKVVLVLGVSHDKDKDSICSELKSITRHTIFTKADHPRAGDLQDAVDVRTALDRAREEADHDDIILVTGSIFVVSEARRYLLLKEDLCTS